MTGPFMSGRDMQQLKEYVQSNETGMRQAESTVLLHVAHSNLKAHFHEIRFDLHMLIGDVKHKLSTMCGTPAASMTLQLKDEHSKVLCTMYEDARPLGYFSPHSGCTLYIIDNDPTSLSAGGWLEDVSKVDKYVMSDEDYSRRDNTYRKYKEAKLRDDPEWTLEKEICIRKGLPYTAPVKREFDDDFCEAEASSISEGSRCSVEPGDRRGAVRFVGKVEGLPAGWWVGVQYDEPLGKNDGSVKGRKYFSCSDGYGAFVRPDKVSVGDYPPVDDFSDLGSDDEI